MDRRKIRQEAGRLGSYANNLEMRNGDLNYEKWQKDNEKVILRGIS